jgi:hypothetical protein
MPSQTPALRGKLDPDCLPARLDHECDIDLPRRLFSTWLPDGGPRATVRPLAAEERAKLEARAVALQDALRPFAGDDATVRASVNGLFAGFRSMRQQGDEALAVVDVTLAVLSEFPAWAIATVCGDIVRGKTKIDRRFAPNDTEIYDVVSVIVRPYRDRLTNALALLSAPVEPPVEPNHPPRAVGRPPSGRLASIPDTPTISERRVRLLADLEARKARNEAQKASEPANHMTP